MIRYHVSIPDPASHTLRVRMEFETTGDETSLWIASWTPGSYLMREFARYLGPVHVETMANQPCPARKTAKGTWLVRAERGTHVAVTWDAWCHELSVRTPHVDADHAFFTCSNVLMAIEGRANEAATLRVEAPPGWSVNCPLPTRDGAFQADDWDRLADAPVECGPHPVHEFHVAGVPHRMVFWGAERVRPDFRRLEDEVGALVARNASLFGGDLPYSSYLFIFHVTARGRGGLEHFDSCVLATPWEWWEDPKLHADLLALIAHEHFHVWNVKRIRPRALGPFDYRAENYTRALWVSEGFTSYYEGLQCVRAGLLPRERYLERLAVDLTKLMDTPGRLVHPLDEASFDAWIRLYRPDENTHNRTVSYYLKGAFVALALDLRIRESTAARQSLDDVMRLLWERYLSTGAGFDEDRVADVILDATGVDVSDCVRDWVESVGEPDFEALLASHGIRVSRETGVDPWFGATFTPDSDGLTVSAVHAGGPAATAGLAAGDRIIAVDGRRANAEMIRSPAGLLTRQGAHELTYFRREELRSAALEAAPPALGPFRLSLADDAPEPVLRLRERWLAGAGANPE